ncbi:MAG: hypothetical protein VXY25_03905 [Pseudomonadota bacterium]|nr:hypothetical protein [Pseudomonadota bacterium]
MARSGETSNGDKAAHGEATMRGGGGRYFKIPPMIDHQAGSFLVDRLRLLGALVMPLHWRRVLLITLFVAAGVGAFVLGGGPQTIFTGAIPTETDTFATGTTSKAKPDSMQGPIAEETPGTTADEEKLQAQIAKLEEKLLYTERKLTAALGQLRDGTVVGEVDRLGRRAALMLTLGTGRPYQALLHDVDPDWLAPEDMGLLRRYGQEGFYDANHLARRLSDLLEGDSQANQTWPQPLPPALAWLTRNAGALVEVRPQLLAQIADVQHDILKALLVDRPDAALRLVDEILASRPDTPTTLLKWRDDLALWRTMAPVMVRLRDVDAGQASPLREPE